MSLKEKIAAANDRPVHEVEVPEWSCTVHLRTGSAYEMEQIIERIQKNAKSGRKDSHHMAWVLSQFLCEDDGTLAYTGDEYKQLGNRSYSVISRLYNEAARINGLIEEEEDEEEAKKKSPEEESGSGSDCL